MKRILRLKDDKIATLTLEKTRNDYLMVAQDAKHNIVGVCKFSIELHYARPLEEKSRALYAKRHKTSIDNAPTEKVIRVGSDGDKYDITYNTLTFNGKVHRYKQSVCELGDIEVLDERFYKVGLGSAMYEVVEKIALENDCNLVEAYYYPNGKFEFGAHDFYVRNGFKFSKKGHLTYAVKDITSLNVDISAENKNGD